MGKKVFFYLIYMDKSFLEQKVLILGNTLKLFFCVVISVLLHIIDNLEKVIYILFLELE